MSSELGLLGSYPAFCQPQDVEELLSFSVLHSSNRYSLSFSCRTGTILSSGCSEYYMETCHYFTPFAFDPICLSWPRECLDAEKQELHSIRGPVDVSCLSSSFKLFVFLELVVQFDTGLFILCGSLIPCMILNPKINLGE